MKKSTKSEQQIVAILKEAEVGVPVVDLCRQYGISQSTFYKWKAKYGGLDASALRRLKELEDENRKLKQMYANLSLEHQVLKEIVEKK
jgi:putative transposase